MNEEFRVHMLNDEGKQKAREIAEAFNYLLNEIEALCSPTGREIAIVRTKLEEACFFAKKAMASRTRNQQ